ncbi:MAG: hypothetical protein MUP98_12945 [Candidatus Aminicenantes bacterium]|nr:hypothetical protein [Candidatus Aminicenantes bacterium]
MKTTFKLMVLGVFVVFLLASCSKPQQALDEAKVAVEATKTDGAEIYAAEEFKKLNDDLTATEDEVETQGKKFLKSYGTSKDMLAKVKTDAEALKALLPERKEKAKNDATAMMEEARVALEEAKSLLEKAPRGKGTQADIDAFTADLAGLESSLVEVQGTIDGGNYFDALDSAKIIKEKATSISDQIKLAIEKVKK